MVLQDCWRWHSGSGQGKPNEPYAYGHMDRVVLVSAL